MEANPDYIVPKQVSAGNKPKGRALNIMSIAFTLAGIVLVLCTISTHLLLINSDFFKETLSVVGGADGPTAVFLLQNGEILHLEQLFFGAAVIAVVLSVAVWIFLAIIRFGKNSNRKLLKVSFIANILLTLGNIALLVYLMQFSIFALTAG